MNRALTAVAGRSSILGTVNNVTTKLLLVFEDERDTLDAVAKQVKKALGATAIVKARSASEVAVAEILAADAYIFGVDNPDARVWAEVKRLLHGMNLAGRKAAFYSSAKGATKGLKTAFASSELRVVEPDLDASGDAGAWATALIGS